MNNINLRNMYALPGIFCLANPHWRDSEDNPENISHLDTNLNIQILLSLIENTTFADAPRDE
jgi:hypothetical protein